MKKTILAVLALLLVFALVACSSPAPAQTTEPAAEEKAPASEEAKEEAAEEEAVEEEATEEAADDSWTKVEEAGKFILGMDEAFIPMGYRDENGEFTGFDVEVATEVCKRLGVELVCQPIVWDTLILEVTNENVDCVWNGLSVNEERQEKLLMSEPYMKNRMAIVVSPDSEIAGKADLAGKVVGAQAGSSAVDAIRSEEGLEDSFGELVEMKDNAMALTELKLGSVDAVIADETLIGAYVKEDPDSYKIITTEYVGPEEDYAIGFRKGDQALCDKIVGTLKEMKADGKLGEIATKWFSYDLTTIGE